jgi:hypothetical protein
MTNQEFSNEFDILLNQRFNGLSFEQIDEYEKSVYLTRAQEQVVREYAKIFEENERARRALANIVRNYSAAYDSTFNTAQANIKIDDLSKLFQLPAEVKYIVTEQVVTADNTRHRVKPITHDEWEILKSNPFREPTYTKVWDRAVRLDLSYVDNGVQLVEIIYPQDITVYNFRYVREPVPIILDDVFVTGYDDPYLKSIRGLSTASECELDSFIHEEILSVAVNLAANTLGLTKQTNNKK